MSRMDRLLSEGLQRLFGYAARRVAYRRGSQVVYLDAVPGQTRVEASDQVEGVTVVGKVQDWIFRVEDLQALFPPREGDAVEDQGHVYLAARVGEELWRWSDPDRKYVRIHSELDRRP